MNKAAQVQVKTAPTASFTPVRSSLLQRKCACGGMLGLDGECAECRSKPLHRSSINQTEPSAVPPIVHEVLRSPGQPLEATTRDFMEPRFNYDFSQVRVHTDTKAAESAYAVNALAYTVGRDVVFGEGQYVPGSSEGQRLLAHELTHVVQQQFADNDTRNLPQDLPISKLADRHEFEAEAMSAQVTAGEPAAREQAHTVVQTKLNQDEARIQRVVGVVRRIETDDETTREARRRLDQAKQLLNDSTISPAARADLDARIREAETSLQNYRRTLHPGGVMSNPIVATTTTGDTSGLSALVVALVALAGALFASQTLSNRDAREALGRALQRVGEAIDRARPVPLSKGETQEAPPQTQSETQTETQPEPEQRPRPPRPPRPGPLPCPLPTGLTPIDPIPMVWYKVEQDDYYPPSILIQGTEYRRGEQTTLPHGEPIGVPRTYWPQWGKTFQLLPETRGPNASRFRAVLAGYGFSWEGLQADHVQDLQWEGPDVFENLWPMDARANMSAGPRQNDLQIVSFCETLVGPPRSVPLRQMKAEGHFGRWFVIGRIER